MHLKAEKILLKYSFFQSLAEVIASQSYSSKNMSNQIFRSPSAEIVLFKENIDLKPRRSRFNWGSRRTTFTRLLVETLVDSGPTSERTRNLSNEGNLSSSLWVVVPSRRNSTKYFKLMNRARPLKILETSVSHTDKTRSSNDWDDWDVFSKCDRAFLSQ